MSTTMIYVVKNNGDVVFYNEARNSFAGAMHVWNSLNNAYDLGDLGMFFGFDIVWKNFGKGLYTDFEDIVLGSTFDNVMVKKENLDKMIGAFENFVKKYPSHNLEQQIEIFKAVKKENVFGVCWCQNSVADDVWDYYNEELDEIESYNIFEGDKHWFLFDKLNWRKNK